MRGRPFFLGIEGGSYILAIRKTPPPSNTSDYQILSTVNKIASVALSIEPIALLPIRNQQNSVHEWLLYWVN